MLGGVPFPVAPLRTGPIAEPKGEQTRYSVALYGPKDAMIESQALRLPVPHLERADDARHFTALLPWNPSATALVVKKDDRVLKRFRIAAKAPVVSLERPARGQTLQGRYKLSWKAGGAGASYTVRYSPDGGESWRYVAGNLKGTSVSVDLDALPGGERCLFQVLAHAGLRTSTATSAEFRVPQRPAQLLIASPRNGENLDEGSSVYLFGAAFLPGGAMASPDHLQWSSDRDGALGAGSQVMVQTLSAGEHRITLQSDAAGVKPVSVRIMVRAKTRAAATSAVSE
jgi:hypothetical protein